MPTVEEIRTLTIKAKTEGYDKVTGDNVKLQASLAGIAGVTQNSAKSTLSLANSYEAYQRRIDPAYNRQQLYIRGQEQLIKFSEQGLIPTIGRYNELLAMNEKRYGTASTASRLFREATSGVAGQMIALSAGAGPVGTFLSGLGPMGIAAAAALGLASSAFSTMADESLRMGRRAVDIRAFTEATELSGKQFKALKNAGEEFAVSGESIQTSFLRMTASLNAAHRGTGPLYESIQLINGGLAIELQQSRTTTEAINILAKAYNAAGDSASRAALARAIFGRSGVNVGQVLGVVGTAGGLDELVAKTSKLGSETDSQTARWAKMTLKIEESKNRTANILAAIYTDDGLARALRAAEVIERAAKASADLAKSSDKPAFIKGLADYINSSLRTGLVSGLTAVGATGAAEGVTGIFEKQVAHAKKARAEIDAVFRDVTVVGTGSFGLKSSDIEQWRTLGGVFVEVASNAKLASDSIERTQQNAANYAARQGEGVSFLGSSATVREKTQASIARLTSEFYNNKTGADNATEAWTRWDRAVKGVKIDAFTAQLSANVGALGNAARADEILAAAVARLSQQHAKGEISANAFTRAIENQKNIVVPTATLQERAALGIASSQEIATLKQNEYNAAVEKYKPSAEEAVRISTALNKKYRDIAESSEAVSSRLPNFTRLRQDTLDLEKQFDNFAVSGVNNLSSALTDISMGTKSTGEAFQALGLSVVRSLQEMIIKMMLFQVVSAAMGSGGGGIGGSIMSIFGGGMGGGAMDVNNGFVPFVGGGGIIPGAKLGGIVGELPPFGRGGIVGEPTPIMAHRGEGVFTPGQMKAMGNSGPNITYAPVIDARGADAAAVARLAGALADDRKNFAKNVISVQRKARESTPGYR